MLALHLVPPTASTDTTLRELIAKRDRLLAEAAVVEQQMRPLMREFADARGEMMLPSVERLRRELL